jgi:hypothetical protein
MAQGFTCPVCGYDDPKLPQIGAEWRDEICPSCGTQFGYDDASTSHEDLRQRWLNAGARWSSRNPAPANFNGLDQLRKAGLLE